MVDDGSGEIGGIKKKKKFKNSKKFKTKLTGFSAIDETNKVNDGFDSLI